MLALQLLQVPQLALAALGQFLLALELLEHLLPLVVVGALLGLLLLAQVFPPLVVRVAYRLVHLP